MNFNREDQAMLREVKIQKEGALGPEQLRELYSAEIDLYGNTLFKNGSYIYLDPKLMGSTPEQLRILGLHGYYLITGVSSTVTENSFDVSVSALHEGVAFRDEVLMSPETYTDLTPENEPYMSPDQRRVLAEASVNEGEVPGGGESGLPDLRTEDQKTLDALLGAQTIHVKAIQDLLAAGDIDHAEYVEYLRTDPYTDQLNELRATGQLGTTPVDTSTPAE
jgi:hypothetical protein